MIEKYTIDLKQFNNGESERITFPTFETCLLYGVHKLKNALLNKKAVIRAILIEASYGRKIVVTPSPEELGEIVNRDPFPRVKLRIDLKDNTTGFLF